MKPDAGQLYDQIGKNYNVSRRADPYIANRIYSLLAPQQNKLYLDIGCGTGNYTISLAAKGIQFTGTDPSEKMLAEAKSKSPAIAWQLASAENLPFENDYFSGAIATLTIHHWKNIDAGFAELFRVLKSDSRLVLFSSTPE